MFQSHFQDIRPLTTAHLAQTMALLSLTNVELRQQIESEIAANPALEIKDERRCPTCKRVLPERGPCPICTQASANTKNEPVVFISPRDDFYSSNYTDRDNGDSMMEDSFTPSKEDLSAYIYRLVAAEISETEQQILIFLLASLDDDGFITIGLDEVASYFHVPLAEVKVVQKAIQRIEPYGIGSQSPVEALMIQLEMLTDICPNTQLARQIIGSHLDMLSHRQFSEMAKLLECSSKEIEQAAKFIGDNLYPFPGRAHWGDQRQPGNDAPSAYHQPDIIINHVNEDPTKPLAVEIIMPLSGTLRVNPLFKQAIKEADDEKKEEWKNDLERASLFVKCIQQRNHTMKRLMQRIVSIQTEFIIHGEKYLNPVTRVQISRELGVHESTISRAVSNKSVQLPNRKIIPMAAFFDRSLQTRTVLKEIIQKENKPLSDSELVKLLARQGYDVARRTVAKYRAMEGILPAHMRKIMTSARQT